MLYCMRSALRRHKINFAISQQPWLENQKRKYSQNLPWRAIFQCPYLVRGSQAHQAKHNALIGVTAPLAHFSFKYTKYETGPSEIAGGWWHLVATPTPSHASFGGGKIAVQWMSKGRQHKTPGHLICLRSFEISYLTLITKLVFGVVFCWLLIRCCDRDLC